MFRFFRLFLLLNVFIAVGTISPQALACADSSQKTEWSFEANKNFNRSLFSNNVSKNELISFVDIKTCVFTVSVDENHQLTILTEPPLIIVKFAKYHWPVLDPPHFTSIV